MSVRRCRATCRTFSASRGSAVLRPCSLQQDIWRGVFWSHKFARGLFGKCMLRQCMLRRETQERCLATCSCEGPLGDRARAEERLRGRVRTVGQPLRWGKDAAVRIITDAREAPATDRRPCIGKPFGAPPGTAPSPSRRRCPSLGAQCSSSTPAPPPATVSEMRGQSQRACRGLAQGSTCIVRRGAAVVPSQRQWKSSVW